MIKYNNSNINDWNFGSDNIVKVYYGATSGSTSRVPQGYTEVEYVQNNGNVYLNTGIDPYSSTGNSFTVEFTLSSYTQSNLTYLLSCESSQSPYNGFVARWNNGFKVEGNSVVTDTTYQLSGNANGTSSLTLHSDSTTTMNNNTPITIFAGLNGSSPWRYGKGRLYSLSMTLNNNQVRNLVPCTRDSDSKAGVYDVVNNVFYEPSGGNLIAGSAVTPTATTTVGNVIYQKITSGSTPPTPPTPFTGKWIGYYSDSTAYSADCGSSSVIGRYECREGNYTAYTKVVIGDCVTDIRESFQNCSSLLELEIGSGVTSDLYYAFQGCSALTSVTWYATSLSSQDGGFDSCTSLTKLVMYASSPPSISNLFLKNAHQSLIVYVPDNSVTAYQSANRWGGYTIKGHSEL